VMPEALIDYCSAPVPYVIGVHSSLMPRVSRMPLDAYVLVDVDAGTVTSPFTDENSMPVDLMGNLRAKIKESRNGDDDRFARGFADFFTALLHGHAKFITTNAAGKLAFDEDGFLATKSKGAGGAVGRRYHATNQLTIDGDPRRGRRMAPARTRARQLAAVPAVYRRARQRGGGGGGGQGRGGRVAL
jgi:hypothetical protein